MRARERRRELFASRLFPDRTGPQTGRL